MSHLSSFIRLCRPTHWIKNLLIFTPLIFSGHLLYKTDLFVTLGGWFAFNFMASAVYVFNDLRDIESDKAHEIKKNRPLARGDISTKAAVILCGVLAILAVVTNMSVTPTRVSVALLALYGVLNVAYSLGAKKVPLLDIALLVSGFLIRIFYGAVLISQGVSAWLYLTVMTMATYLGLGKRRNELRVRIDSEADLKGVWKFYTPEFLDKNMYMCLTLTIAFYALWAISPSAAIADISPNRVWSVPVVLLICMRYSLLIESGKYADPVDILVSDRILKIMVLLYGAGMLCLLY